MPRLHLPTLALLLACIAPAASAQQTIQQRMTAEEFRSAGLDRLSADELASLDRWLQRQVQEEASAATEQAREEGRAQARREAREAGAGAAGGRSTAADGPLRTSIAGEFSGFARGQRYTLANGQVWEQTDASRLEGVRASSPAVTLTPGVFGTWYLRIDGYNTRAKVRRVD